MRARALLMTLALAAGCAAAAERNRVPPGPPPQVWVPAKDAAKSTTEVQVWIPRADLVSSRPGVPPELREVADDRAVWVPREDLRRGR